MEQSERGEAYDPALNKLSQQDRGLLRQSEEATKALLAASARSKAAAAEMERARRGLVEAREKHQAVQDAIRASVSGTGREEDDDGAE